MVIVNLPQEAGSRGGGGGGGGGVWGDCGASKKQHLYIYP